MLSVLVIFGVIVSALCTFVNRRVTKSSQIPQKNPPDPDKYTKILDIHSKAFYSIHIHQRSTVMSIAYQQAQKQRVRITLDLNVLQDFNARDIDFEKLFQLEPTESVEVYIEEFDRY
jgi:hypothetical protein